jgi:NADP-dependent 3-hydroxy acid dehydrogenase YdfG
MSRRWFITGGTPGNFGMAFAEAALETGDRVALTSRRPEALATWAEQYGDRVLVVPLELTDAAQVQRAVRAAEEHFGGIDVLVNNAGRGWYGSIEGMDESSMRAMFELNFFAVLSVTRAVLPGMRARGNGWIVNVSSVAGLLAAPGFGYYSATKYAIEAVTDALREEVAAQGISVGGRTGSVPHQRLRWLRERARRGDDSAVPRHAGAGPRRLRRDGRDATR